MLLTLIATYVVPGFVTVTSEAQGNRGGIPTFEYDATWPKPLPNNWIMGNIGAMTTDAQDHIWVAQRPASTTNLSERYGLEGLGECCFPAPPILEFDMAGNLIQSWGPIHGDKGELLGKQVWQPIPNTMWPPSEHGIFVDHKGNVWVGSSDAPSIIAKYSRDGKKHLLQIGKVEGKSINDTMNLAGTTGLWVDAKTNELYVADGYRNRRVIVFDADTGAYKRHWGAYGKKPPDGPQGSNPVEGKYDPSTRSQQFATVHDVTLSKDGMVYVSDRVNNRVQAFKTDGTYVNEVVVGKGGGFGAAFASALSPDERFLYVADGQNKKVHIVQRSDLKIVGAFGSGGRGGGQMLVLHDIVTDSKGNIYLGETINNNRVQKFKLTGTRGTSN
jgi:hypothetical protein